ncbi:MAG TPA: toll/interleukin-1 receptor domain-containing protein [Pyrinomonadaceae bacterium]|nr:toll/interleukin-1 receptor domain-containing protein [Pyrinomonadaceae bacterium]
MVDSNSHRYRAFISYSQLDQQHAKRLHSALETYRVPRGIDAPLDPNRRLGRFFRDDDEMGAATDLGGTLRTAIENSENLIVICSPHAAGSKWVNAEIQHFKNTGRGDRIFAVIVAGTPGSDDPAQKCFPAALSTDVVGEGLLSNQHAEPLAIDLSKESFQRAHLRLVAGLLGVSFDSLWQRDRRRTTKRRAIAAAVSLAVVLGFILLGVRWLTERSRAHDQRMNVTLARVRDDLASERVKEALTELNGLYAEGERGAVEELLKSTLSWVATPTELFEGIKAPAFVSNGPQLFLIARDGNRRPLNIHQPSRRILSSDGKWLLIVGADEVVALDVADGRELSRVNSNQITWSGNTFETGGGLLIVGGRFVGMTNGTIRDSLLVFSPQRQTLSVFNPTDYWQDDPQGPRFISPLAVSPDCRSFGFAPANLDFNTKMSLLPEEVFTFSETAGGLKPQKKPAVSVPAVVAEPPAEGEVETPAPKPLAGWQQGTMLDADEPEGIAYGPPSFGSARCVAPAADSADPDASHALTGLFHPVGFGVAWEAERRWKVTGDAKEENLSREPDENSPCKEAHPCAIQDPENDRVEDFPGIGSFVTDFTPPRGISHDDRSFDFVDKEKVHVFNGGNATYMIDYCRRLNSKAVCLEEGSSFDPSGIEQEQQTEIDLRSSTGRFIFYPQGLAGGFRLYDLLTMRNVTPQGPELIASTHWADFSADDKRLFVAMSGRLQVFEPGSEGSRWQKINDGSSVQNPALSGNQDKKNDQIAGLLALDNDSLLVVRSGGVISRFDWRTGQQSWGHNIGNVGEIIRVVTSRNRRFVLLIGRLGGRLLDTRDGLVLSGVLVPPEAMAGSVGMLKCFNDAFVTDTGVVDVSCGKKKYQREPVLFTGDVTSRLKAILSQG